MDKEEKKSSKKPYLIVIAYFLAIVILMGMVYSYLLEEEVITYPPVDTDISLEYNGTIYPNVHKIDVKDDGTPHLELQEVTIVVFGIVNETPIMITNNTLLSDAKNYSLYAFPYTFISYFDNDNDNRLTTGDFITITIEPSNPGNYTVRLIHNRGIGLATHIFEIK
jgi:hypothetical protein